MKPRKLFITLCMSVIAACAQSAVLLAQDGDVIVARGEPRERRSVDTATDKPYEHIKMTEMRVRSEIALRYARTSVVTRVQNPDARPQEVTFRMLLPDTAFISGFTMIIDGTSYKAYVKEKQEAKQIYSQAVSQGVGAAHIATKARDSNHFTVSVNVEGNTTATFDLRYEDFLVSRNGLYSHVINLHPGALIPVMEVVVHIKETQKITKLHVPELRTGNEIDATQNNSQNLIAVIENGTDNGEVTITFTPDLKEQRRLAKIYLDKSKDAVTSTVLGQFVVEYDVERSNNGEILVNDGYFVHFLAPTSLPPLSKHVVFVLDTSWSMAGRKIDQLRKAMDTILSDLHSNDYFTIIEFNTIVKIYEFKDNDAEEQISFVHWPSDFSSAVPRVIASPHNIAKAKRIVSRLERTGSTDIYSALEAALSIAKRGVQQKTENKKTMELEPIIFFLTDGEAFHGITNTDRIIQLITEKNSDDTRAILYSIAFGNDADRSFLRKLSLRNDGFMRHIYEASDAALQLHDFYRQVSSPLLANVRFIYPENQIKEGSVSRNRFRTINAGSEAVVVGQIADDVTEFTPQIVGLVGNEEDLGLTRYEVTPTVAVSSTKDERLPLERLWAYLTIQQLLDKRDAGDGATTGENTPEKKALAIALKYAFVTPLTSLVVVKPNETNAVDVESADKLPTAAPVWAYRPRVSSYITTPAAPAQPQLNYMSGANIFSDVYNGMQTFNNIGNGRSNTRTLALSTSNFDYGSDRVYARLLPRPSMQRNYGRFGYPRRAWGGGGGPSIVATTPTSNKNYNSYTTQAQATATNGNYYITTRQTTTVSTDNYNSPTTETLTTAANGNHSYHLEGFEWTTSLHNRSSDTLLVVVANGNEVILKLTTDINPPKEDGGDIECPSSASAAGATAGADGACVYLTRCRAARHITADDYRKSYCIVNNRYAGVCCPKDEIDRTQ